MKSTQLLLYLAGLAALALVLTLAGVPVGTALVITAVLACLMMMFFMMSGDRGRDNGTAGTGEDSEISSPARRDEVHHEAADANRNLR